MSEKNPLRDKLILAFYVNVKNISSDSIESYVEKWAQNMGHNYDENIIKFFIPIKKGENRVEVIPNPFAKN